MHGFNLFIPSLPPDEWLRARSNFVFVDALVAEANRQIRQWGLGDAQRTAQPWVAVHWRRGDYLSFKPHTALKYRPASIIEAVRVSM